MDWGTRSSLPLWLRGTRSNGSWGRRGSIFFGSGRRRDCPRRPTFSSTRTGGLRPPVVFPTSLDIFGCRVSTTAVTAVDWHWPLASWEANCREPRHRRLRVSTPGGSDVAPAPSGEGCHTWNTALQLPHEPSSSPTTCSQFWHRQTAADWLKVLVIQFGQDALDTSTNVLHLHRF